MSSALLILGVFAHSQTGWPLVRVWPAIRRSRTDAVLPSGLTANRLDFTA